MEVGHLMVQAWQAVKEGYFILRLKRWAGSCVTLAAVQSRAA
jgi:hypothetical protein